MIQSSKQMIHTCAKCGTQADEQEAISNEYKCQKCEYELAHLDIAANGAIRGVFGWLKETQAEIGGRYQVETVLGKGGFGATYLVLDQRVKGKRWALKEIPEILFDEYEVTLLSQLDHPSIPIIVDRFIDEEMVYLVLKFGGTKTLATECKKQHQIAYKTIKPWIIQLADVLKYLHRRTPPIIHRDLKPENILIDDEDRIMLIDFGIAKESLAETATRTLGRAASHGFSPPEQVMGTGTDVRSDIYSFAATAYFALTGKSPVAAHERVAGAILQSPSELISGIPFEVDAMLTKALNLNINDRPQTISEFVEAFTDTQQQEGDSEQTNKTVQISDIQFGPVVNKKLSRSTPKSHQSELPIQKNSRSKFNGLVFSIVGGLALSAIGLYLFMNNQNGDSETNTSPEFETSEIIAPNKKMQTAPNEIALTTKTPKQDKNTPSALDILNKRLETQKTIETQTVKKESAEDKLKIENKVLQTKRIKKATTARAQNRVPSSKKSIWGNQPRGTF